MTPREIQEYTVPGRTPSRSATSGAVRRRGTVAMASDRTTCAPDGGRQQRPAIGVAWASRIPLARIADGPSGLPWFVEAVWSNTAGRPERPALLVRPCWRPAFRPEVIERLRRGVAVGTIEDCLLHPTRPDVREPVALPHRGGVATVEVEPYPLLDLVDRAFGPEDRRRILDTAPWTLLVDDHAARLGLEELAEMDPVDAAYAAVLRIRLARQFAGRGPDRVLPTPAVSLVGALVVRRMTIASAAGRVANLTGASVRALADGHRAAVRARRRGPVPVVVADPVHGGVTDLRDWVRMPRVARMVCVLATGRVGAVEALLSRDRTVGGWLARRSLPLVNETVETNREAEPPTRVVADDITREGESQHYRVWGLAQDRDDLLQWFQVA